jgi:hypothetical protein
MIDLSFRQAVNECMDEKMDEARKNPTVLNVKISRLLGFMKWIPDGIARNDRRPFLQTLGHKKFK